MLDFTSSLYLGLRHASSGLRPWAQLTTGVPATLSTPPLARTVSARLAGLIGTQRATLCRSTLHAFWDLFLILGERKTDIYVDACAYPIARWGVERAACRGIPVRTFRHRDYAGLARQLEQDAPHGRRPVIVADGFCTGCATFAPIRQYLAQAQRFGGTVVLDDTQALGIFGHSLSSIRPYGYGGGGSLRAHGICDGPLVVVNSLAKGFGVPMAVVAGKSDHIERFERHSSTQVHTSPPSFADLRAAESALKWNQRAGDATRAKLGALISRFQRGLRATAIPLRSPFPVQSLWLRDGLDPAAFYRALLRTGIRAVLHRPACRRGTAISLIITARHTPAAIDRAVAAIVRLAGADSVIAAPSRAFG